MRIAQFALANLIYPYWYKQVNVDAENLYVLANPFISLKDVN